MKQTKNSKGILVTLTICFTIIAVSVIGGLMYMQKQNIAQKEREFQQQKQLKEYEQNQINARNKEDNIERCRAAAATSSNPFDSIGCNKE